MAVESASDLASMFDDEEFAEAASYLAPGGAAVDCLVIVDRGQGRKAFTGGEQQLATSERMLWVRKTADGEGGLAAVVRGGVFTLELDGEELTVADLPALDHTGQLWSVELVEG
jgi:hypothetical protein